MKNKIVQSALFGLAVGDALGVPVEFISRENLAANPVSDMMGFGTHRQPMGTWSDDSSLSFCLAESLCHGYNLNDLGNRFLNWIDYGYWAAQGRAFGIGNTTSEALTNLRNGIAPVLAGGIDESNNGNGSLMRILPLLFYIKDLPIQERFQATKEVSSLTHAHIRSIISCFIYLEMALQIIKGKNKFDAFFTMQTEVSNFLSKNEICNETEFLRFRRILVPENKLEKNEIPIYKCIENDIHSTGYVIHALEVCFWTLLGSDNYSDTVLKAINLGNDTDTNGAIAGGLSGLLYGFETIPEKWIDLLARKNDINELCQKLSKTYEIQY